MKAKARRDRWAEESVIISSEMDWTITYLQNQAKRWRHRAGPVPNELRTSDDASPSEVEAGVQLANEGLRGHISYAFRQEKMWLQFAAMAIQKFSNAKN